MVFVDAKSRTPSSGYVISLVFAAAGVFFVTVALVGALLARAGSNPLAASGWPGQVAFASAFLVLFASRLVFWSKASPGLQALVRTALTGLLVVMLVLAAVSVGLTGLVIAGGRAAHPVFLIGFAALAAASQIGTVLWLLKHRGE